MSASEYTRLRSPANLGIVTFGEIETYVNQNLQIGRDALGNVAMIFTFPGNVTKTFSVSNMSVADLGERIAAITAVALRITQKHTRTWSERSLLKVCHQESTTSGYYISDLNTSTAWRDEKGIQAAMYIYDPDKNKSSFYIQEHDKMTSFSYPGELTASRHMLASCGCIAKNNYFCGRVTYAGIGRNGYNFWANSSNCFGEKQCNAEPNRHLIPIFTDAQLEIIGNLALRKLQAA